MPTLSEKRKVGRVLHGSNCGCKSWSVDVGVIEVWGEERGKRVVNHNEIDIVVNTGFEKVYIQSAFEAACAMP